jgi:tetratricopeptide (TPR) repeat protein
MTNVTRFPMKRLRSTVALVVLFGTLAGRVGGQLLPEARPVPPSTRESDAGDERRGFSKTNTPAARALPDMGRKISELRRKVGLPDTDAATCVNLGDALMQKSRESAESRVYDEAEAAYRRALAFNPENEDAMVGLAWVCNSRHDFNGGKQWAEKALAINLLIPQAHALLGDAATEWGDYDTALGHYQKALDIRPDLSSYSRAAHIVWLTGDARKAQLLMGKAIAAGAPHAENTAWCRAELALMSFNTGALLPAERQAELALKEAPGNPRVLAVMGRIKTAKKEYEAAIDFYLRANAVSPSHESLVGLGDLYALTGRREESEAQYRRLVDLHKTGLHSHGGGLHAHLQNSGDAQLARFYADHDRNLEEALREAQMAHRTYTNVFVTDTLAWCYYKLGRYDDADKTIRAAMRWNTPDAAILFHAGMINAKRGDRVAAGKLLYRALNLNPNFHPQQAIVAADELKLLAIQRAEKSAEEAKPDN